jgi:hypothetical protein
MTEATSSERRVRMVLGVVAAALVVLAFWLPVWEARLSAPQYPEGLTLTACGRGVEGDISEINELNHYVGMRAFSVEAAPEMILWAPAVISALLLVVVGTLGGSTWWGRLARLALWVVPVLTLADVQFRLYQYGHSVKPDATIRLDPFIPWVVGKTDVLNFTTWAFPGGAVWCLFGAAFLVTFGPEIVRRAPGWWQRLRKWWAGQEEDEDAVEATT